MIGWEQKFKPTLHALSLLLLSGCALPSFPSQTAPEKTTATDAVTLTPVAYTQLPGWNTDGQGDAFIALRRSCKKINSQPPGRSLGAEGLGGTMADWKQACHAAAFVDDGDHMGARAYLEKWFQPYRVNGDGLITGYFETSLNGSPVQTPRYRTPVYKRPSDLVLVDLGEFSEELKGQRTAGRVIDGKLRPYEDRAAIRKGALLNKGLELVWVDDPIATFFLHIQGSGRVRFDDGKEMRIGYDGHNGHDYFAIGRALIDRGILTKEKVSLQSIRKWLRDNPGEANGVMDLNRSYIFFRELTGEGPIGAQGVALSPGRSLAVDRRFIPLGAPLWLDTTDPLSPEKPLQRLVIAQDTGGAIKGPVRGDLFWGVGSEAMARAGLMKQTGKYYLFLPKTLEIPVAVIVKKK